MGERVLGRLIFCFVLFINYSCQKYSSYSVHSSGSSFVAIEDSFIVDVSVVKWSVGVLHKDTISKGINLKIKMPIMDSSDVKEMVAAGKVDSWLLRVRKMSYSGSSEIGYVKIPIIIPGRTSEMGFKIKQLDYVQLNIYYSSIAVSSRFESLQCPPIDQSKEIGTITLEDSVREMNKITIGATDQERVPGKIEQYGYKPMVLSGGMELTGRYAVDIALLDSNRGSRVSSYFELPSAVEVSGERAKILKGCFNFKVPTIRPNDPDLYQNFRFR